MNSYYFILGRENKISQKELESVLASFDFGFNADFNSILSEHVLEIKLDQPVEKVANLINILGGTVKIFKKVAPKEAKIEELLLAENFDKKRLFGISNYSSNELDTFKLALSAKKKIKKSLRIIAGKEGDQLSSAQSFQYKMDLDNIEYGRFDSGWGKLIAVQNLDLWTKHDYGKPRSDAVSGMLPPKLARMMVNMAIESSAHKPLVVDPFCGSGNVLIEALAVGCNVIGSDISEKAVDDTRVNLEWAIKNVIPTEMEGSASEQDFLAYFQNDNINVSKQDATKIDFGKIEKSFVVVTEPYLGKPRNSKLRIEEEKEVKEDAKKLYLDFFQNLHNTNSKFLAACIVFPLFELANGKRLSIFEECVDFIKELGYTTICSPLIYGRDYQVVKREIIILKKNGT